MVLKGIIPRHPFLRLAYSPFTEAELDARLAEQGLGTTLVEAAAEGAATGAERGSWVGVTFGAALGLGAVVWAFWRTSSSEETPSPRVAIRASANEFPPPDFAVDLPGAVSPANDDVEYVADPRKMATIASDPFTKLEDAEAELVRLTAAASKDTVAPYAVIQDTETGYYYVCDIREHDTIGSSLRFVSFAVKLGPQQSMQSAIPPQSALIQNAGDPIRTIGVWSASKYVIVTTTPIGNTPGQLAELQQDPTTKDQERWMMVYHLDYEFHNGGQPTRLEYVMLTWAKRPYIQLLIPVEILRGLTTASPIKAWLATEFRHPLSGEKLSFTQFVKVHASPVPNGAMVYFPKDFGSAFIRHYESGDPSFVIPSSNGTSLPAYIPFSK